MKRYFPLLLVLVFTACAGAQVEKQKKEIEDLQTKAGSMYTELRGKADEVAALQAAKAELETRIVELEGRASAAESRAATLSKSNKSLSDAIGASKDELGEKLNAVVSEKDELARKLSDTLKEKLALDRLKTVLHSARDKAGRELARLKDERENLLLKLAGAETNLKKTDAETRAAAEARAASLLRTREQMGSVADAVLAEMQAGKASLEQDGEAFTVVVDAGALFEEGGDKITDEGSVVLGRLGKALKALPSKAIRLEAHSDNAPFKKGLLGGYRGHWELTAARATAAARWLHEHAGLDPARLCAAGFGEFRPAKPNDTPEGRAANRRLVIFVSPA